MSKEPIHIRQHVFKSAASAASYFGLRIQAIYIARKRGTLDSVGLGSGGDRGNNPRLTSVTIDKIKYNSLKEAERKTGIPYHKIRLMAEAERNANATKSE
jgi:hypothetical protein